MIKIENANVYGFEAAIRGMRNPKNSWEKSDSHLWESSNYFEIGINDAKLMKSLCKAGSDHRKFMRFITVTCDITAPLYWIAEHDTYKVATVRNSCSFMHKGTSKPFSVDDFSIQDQRIYYLLKPLEAKKYELTYPYETDEYKIYELENGRKYKVFKNGRIVSCEFSYVDNYGTGRERTFPEREISPSKTRSGYYEVNVGGRSGEKWLVHRLVAYLWIDNPNEYETVNHKDGNKGNNSIENLEWCTRAENIKDGFENGLYDQNKLHLAYNAWKRGHCVVSPFEKRTILKEHSDGMPMSEIAEKHGITKRTLNNMIFMKPCENSELFESAYHWETLIDVLNKLRAEYLETKDISIFKEIRQLLPQGYNVRYTWQANYEVLHNQYHARKNHKLDCWRQYCEWIETLPYAKELIVGEDEDK